MHRYVVMSDKVKIKKHPVRKIRVIKAKPDQSG